jgi:hypothetical protein
LSSVTCGVQDPLPVMAMPNPDCCNNIILHL